MKLRTLVDVIDRYISVAITGCEDRMINVGWNFKKHEWENGVMTPERLIRVEELKNNSDYKKYLMNHQLITFSTVRTTSFNSLMQVDPEFKTFRNFILIIKICKNSEAKGPKSFRRNKNRTRTFKPKKFNK